MAKAVIFECPNCGWRSRAEFPDEHGNYSKIQYTDHFRHEHMIEPGLIVVDLTAEYPVS